MNIVDFFRGIGHALAAAFGVVKKLVPEDAMIAGLELVKEAAVKFTNNEKRRDWVVKTLQKRFPLSESVARLIVELAVAQVKHGILAGIDKIEGTVAHPTP